ncbi:hypothetical protein HJC23_010123 [Cyclotella cryptica]|uniref:MOSC domain-containing protein n=1 Tax=Cyclotella cryptica TaxID=29204 RepID=A0ABD3P768_9STRA
MTTSHLSPMSIKVALFAIWGIITFRASVSAPRTLHTAFHGGAHWRSLLITKDFGRQTSSHRRSRVHFTAVSDERSDNVIDRIAQLLGLQSSARQSSLDDLSLPPPQSSSGKVIRTAARPYQQSTGGSMPSSRYYTTRKPSLPMISVSEAGVVGDYNHYRTVALKSTPDRAVSILTSDVSAYIRSLDGGYFATGYRDGDLGENILVDDVDHSFFRIGERYRFSSEKDGDVFGGNAVSIDEVIVEITEPMEPCANLCKLPYINDPSLASSRERVARCQYIIEALAQRQGLRGWYAKVVSEGFIKVGDSITSIAAVLS